jgi:hypothetical protein
LEARFFMALRFRHSSCVSFPVCACLRATQAYLFLFTGTGSGFGVLLLAFVRQCRGCSEKREVLSAAFKSAGEVETQYGVSPILIQ